MSRAIPEFTSDHNWQHALLRQADEEGAAYFLELLFKGDGNALRGPHSFEGPKVTAEMFLKHPKIKAAFVDKLKAGGVSATSMIAEALRLVVLPTDVCDLIVSRAGQNQLLGTALIRSASEFAVKRIPVEGNAYELHPDDLTELRKQLFALAHTKGRQAKLAYGVLLAIEEEREHHGRPPTEPRHPDIGSGKSWPMDEPDG